MGFPTGRICCHRTFATETRFLVPADRVGSLLDWARARLLPDPHGAGPNGDTYQIDSIYFDTDAFDVFQRNGSYGRSKCRARRYGNAGAIFLERKLKTRDLVSKWRSGIACADLARLELPDPRKGWAGHWFHRRLIACGLAPVCQVAYTRTALVHPNNCGPIRMTLDVGVRAAATRSLFFRDLSDEPTLAVDTAILELKCFHELPRVFAELIDRFSLAAQPISKYRMAIGSLYAMQVAAA